MRRTRPMPPPCCSLAPIPSWPTACAELSGDVDAGELTLEESINGTNISATWTGQVVDGSCGKEIHGTWNNATPPTTLPFVLRKQAGWQ